jgi:segregation and condensation protein A
MLSGSENSHFFEVKLEHFDGPIDLLLHLVKENALPIEKLSLASVADQYLRCVEEAQYLDLELAGEYLVIAATLLSIKSSVLLNKKPELVIDEEGNLVDPHEELLRKLREAAIYKESAEKLANRELLGVHVFATESSLNQVDDGPGTLMQHNATLLAKAFRRILSKVGNTDLAYTVSFEKISIVERMMGVLAILEKEERAVLFEKLIPDLTSRSSVIASFVALLELCKRQIIFLEQSEVFEEIYVTLATRNYQNIKLSSEFDEENPALDDADKKSVNA